MYDFTLLEKMEKWYAQFCSSLTVASFSKNLVKHDLKTKKYFSLVLTLEKSSILEYQKHISNYATVGGIVVMPKGAKFKM